MTWIQIGAQVRTLMGANFRIRSQKQCTAYTGSQLFFISFFYKSDVFFRSGRWKTTTSTQGDEQLLSAAHLREPEQPPAVRPPLPPFSSPKRSTPSPSYPIITLPRSARRSGQRRQVRRGVSLPPAVDTKPPPKQKKAVGGFAKLFSCCFASPPSQEASPLPMKLLPSLGGQAQEVPFARFPPPPPADGATAWSTSSVASCSNYSSADSCCSCSSCSTSSLIEPPLDPSAPHAFTTEDYLKEKPKTTRCLPHCYGACCATCCFMIFCMIGLASLLLYLYFNTSAMREGMTTN